MESYTNQFISDEYGNILHTPSPITNNKVNAVYDGLGNKSALSVGLSSTSITGSLTAGNLVFPSLPNPISLLDFFYPVGDIKITASNINPGISLGGTWQQITPGRFLVSIGNGVDTNGNARTFFAGENSGEYVHKLTIPELPSHNHPILLVQSSQGDDNAVGTNMGTSNRFVRPVNQFTPSLSSSYVGSDGAHNNTVPAFGVYFWQRIS